MVDFDALCEALSRTLSRPLPGDAAHERMAPSHRAQFNPSRTGAREGAVMILLFPEDDGVSTLLTLRRKDLADHPGQISFPGGRREDGETFQQAALRECEEEVGIAQDRVRVLGALSNLFIPPTRFIVHPFIGALSELPTVIPQEREVEAVIKVPLHILQDPTTRQSEEWTFRGANSTVPCYRVDGHIIWGATAMITSELLELLDAVES